MNQKELIGQMGHRLAEEIRVYCRSQKELWRKIPYLALQAGRQDFSGHFGYWGSGGTKVDCATGELCTAPDELYNDPPTPARDQSLLELTTRIDALNAQNIILEHRREIDRRWQCFSSPGAVRKQSEEQKGMRKREADWKKMVLEKLGVERNYTRKFSFKQLVKKYHEVWEAVYGTHG